MIDIRISSRRGSIDIQRKLQDAVQRVFEEENERLEIQLDYRIETHFSYSPATYPINGRGYFHPMINNDEGENDEDRTEDEYHG